MNDDFLRRARRPPPAAFANQLRERLRQQESPTPRSRPSWRLLTAALLIAGSALATATYLTMSRDPQPSASVTPATATQSDTASPVQAGAARRNKPNMTIDATTGTYRASPGSSQPDVSTGHVSDRSPASAEASPSDAATASRAHSPTYPGVWTTPPSVRIAVTPDLEDIARNSSHRSKTPPTFEVTSADTALRGLCTGEPEDRPEIVIASRRIRKDESKPCFKGIEEGLMEATLGHLAVVVTRAKSGSPMQLSVDNVFRALVKSFPAPGDPSRFIDNPYTHWNQIDPALEDRRIEILGPARDSPEFTSLVVSLLEPACNWYSEIKALQESDRSRYEQICHGVREDGVYVSARFDNNFIQQRLWSDPGIVAVLDYRFYANNSGDLLGSLLKGAAPTRESILNGNYAAARTIYFYVSGDRYRYSPALNQFVKDFLRLQSYYGPLLPPDITTDTWGQSRPPVLTEVKPD